MLRIAILSILVFVMLSSTSSMCAEKGEDLESGRLPPGMMMENIGGSNVLVPQGTRIRREGDLRIVEGTGEYAARKFLDIDAHLKRIDSELEALRKEMEELKKSISAIQRDRLIPQKSE
jgi:hypothetical protein